MSGTGAPGPVPAAFTEWLLLEVPQANPATAWQYRDDAKRQFWLNIQAALDARQQ